MIPRTRHYILAALFLGLMSGAGHAAANSDAKAKIATPVILIVDLQRILQESIAAKSVEKQLETQRAHFQSETESEENELRKAEQDLDKARDRMAPDLYAEQEQQLRQRFLDVERRVQARRKVLDEGFTASMNEVRSNLLDVVKDVARERGANLVLTKQEVLWIDKEFDMTDEVLDRLNKKLPQVTVTLTPKDGD